MPDLRLLSTLEVTLEAEIWRPSHDIQEASFNKFFLQFTFSNCGHISGLEQLLFLHRNFLPAVQYSRSHHLPPDPPTGPDDQINQVTFPLAILEFHHPWDVVFLGLPRYRLEA